MVIRQLTADDVTIFYPFRLRSLRESPHAFTNSYEEYRRQSLDSVAQRFRQQAAADIDFTLGAFDDDRLVGIVGFYRESALKVRHKGYIVSLYVQPEDRRRGVGRALLLAALGRIRRLPDLDQVILGVMETQVAARQLYASLGFTAYGREPRAVPRRQFMQRCAYGCLVLVAGLSGGWALRGMEPQAVATVPVAVHGGVQTVSLAREADPNRVILHLDSAAPDKMRAALDQAERLIDEAEQQGRAMQLELIANSRGINLLRAGVSE